MRQEAIVTRMADCVGLCNVIGTKVVRSSVPIYTNGNMVCKTCGSVFAPRKHLNKEKIAQFIKTNRSELFDIVMDLTTGPTASVLENAIAIIHERFKHARCPCCLVGDTLVVGDNLPISDMTAGGSTIGLSGGENKVLQKFVHSYNGELLHIKAVGIPRIIATPEHPFLVVSRKMIDLLPMKYKNRKRLSKCSDGTRKTQLILTEPIWKEAKNLNPKFGGRRCAGDYLILPKIKGTITAQTINIRRFVGAANHRFKLFDFPINEQTAWFFGLYVAEGWTTRKSVCFGLGDSEKELHEKVTDIAKSLGFRTSSQSRAGETTMEVNSRVLARFFPTILGKGASNKRIPDVVLLNADVKILKAFLNGYHQGDGRTYTSSWGKSLLDCTTVSRTLAFQLQLAYACLGIFLSIHEKNGGKGTILGRSVNLRKQYHLVGIIGSRYNGGWTKETPEFYALPVRSVASHWYSGPVYNLETKDHTFIAGNVVNHNCSSSMNWRPSYRPRVIGLNSLMRT